MQAYLLEKLEVRWKIYRDHKLFHAYQEASGNEFTRSISKNKFVSPKVKITSPTKAQVVTGAFMFFKRSLFEEN